MLITFPTGTDAPIYYWPITTGVIILTNIACFALQMLFPDQMAFFYLHHNHFNPLTWVSSSFMHAGIGHIFFNMFYLACVGLVIEGRVGPFKFVGIYLVIALASGLIENLIFLPLGSGGASLGASGIIYGLIAIAMLWMPDSEVNIWVGGWLFFYPFFTTFTVSIMTVAFVMIALEFLIAAFTMFSISSSLLHLLGAIPGFAVGYLMIVRQWVDCEGGDLLTRNFGYKPKVSEAKKEQLRLEKEERKQARRQAIDEAKTKINELVADGHYELAVRRVEMVRRKLHPKANFTPAQVLKIVKAYDAQPEKRKESIYLLDRFLEETPDAPDVLKIVSARQYLLHKEAPRKSLGILKEIDINQLGEKQKKLVAKLTAVANQKIRDGSLEVSG